MTRLDVLEGVVRMAFFIALGMSCAALFYWLGVHWGICI